MRRFSPTIIIVIAASIIAIFGTGYKMGEWQHIQSSQTGENTNTTPGPTITQIQDLSEPAQEAVKLDLFWETWNEIEVKYAEKSKIDRDKMLNGAIKGMVASLEDPYTFFLTPDENKKSKDDLGGKFEGIGAQLGLKNNRIVIVSPLKSSPAEKAGVKGGDYILTVDGKETKDWSLTEAVNAIRGEKGSSVALSLERGGKKVDVNITRDQINVPSVELTMEKEADCNATCPQIAYLKLNQFGDKTESEWNKSVNEIAQAWESGKIEGMVLDVRSNPGGYLEGAVYTASEFLPQGATIVKQESTIGENKEYKVSRKGELLDIPMIVLINEGSASASEILSGALRDYNRAQLVGVKSFGKGSVQQAINFDSGAGLHVTIAKWILPKGDWVNGKGIEPKIEVKNEIPEGETLTRDLDSQLEKAVELLVQ